MFIIRADGNARIGAGHLMRCLTVAEEIKKMAGASLLFVCADEQSADTVEEHGFPAKVLHTDSNRMEEELPVWEAFAREGGFSKERSTLLVDSYGVTDSYLRALGSYGDVFLMDDMAQHAYPVAGVINYNAFAKEDAYRKLYEGTETTLLIGSCYVPIRQQFLHRKYTVRDEVRDVLITTGGGDIDNIAGELLKTIYREGIRFHIVTGKFNPHLEQLLAWKSAMPGVEIYHDVKDMASLMEQCDLAITAGGTTIYELAALGVPFLCFSYAENQEALTVYIGQKQIAGYLGAWHKDPRKVGERLQELFANACGNPAWRRECSLQEQKMIDGKGAKRLAEELWLKQNGRRNGKRE